MAKRAAAAAAAAAEQSHEVRIVVYVCHVGHVCVCAR